MQENAKSETIGERAWGAVPVSLISKWVRQAIDSAVATQRIVLDLAVRQNASTIDALRGKPSASAAAHKQPFTEMAGESVSNFIEAERVFLNLFMKQNEILMTGTRERVGAGGAAAVVDVIGRSVETFIDMQQHFLALAEKHAKSWLQGATSGKTPDANLMMEIIREGTDEFVRSQKKLLDAIAMAAKSADDKGAAKTGAKSRLADLVRESADAFIEMQKTLPEVAGKQLETNLKAARRAAEFVPSSRIDPMELARQYVNNFVIFEQSMLDLLTKPRAAAHEPPPPRAPHRKTQRRPRKAVATVAAKARAGV